MRWLHPENTIEGFKAALEIDVDAIEMDVGMTADGIVAVTHDGTLNREITRDSHGAWLAAPTPATITLRFDELARYDVGRIDQGSAYAARFPEQIPADGARIPRFTEVLALPTRAKLNVETKTYPDRPDISPDPIALTEAVVALADQAGATHRLIVQSFDWRGIRHLRHARPDIAVAWLTEPAKTDTRLWWDGPSPEDFGGSIPRAVAAEGGPTWGPDWRMLNQALIEEAHALGLRVIPWTVNTEADMRQLLAWGVDGLITDRPDIARSILPTPPPG